MSRPVVTEVTLVLASSDLMDYDGVWFDSRASIGADLESRGFATTGLVVGDVG